MKWVIGDVHGCFTELVLLLEQIEFRPWQDRILFLGDLVDRGEQSKAVVDFVRDGQCNGYFDVIRGNHEDEWRHAVEAGVEEWYGENHPETWQDFNGRSNILGFVDWVGTLPTYIETESAILIHGGMNPNKPLGEHTETELLWSRTKDFIPGEYRNHKVVVHGHTPVDYPLILPDRINIDTGCVFGGRLTALSLDALERGEIQWRSVHGWRRRHVG